MTLFRPVRRAKARSTQKMLVLFHGTSREAAERIQTDGFDIPLKTPGWYTFADTARDAIFHSDGWAAQGGPALIEFRLPITTERRKWPGWPWTWPKGPQGWYGLRERVSPEYVVSVRPITSAEIAATKRNH